jgi:hypothetical protein
VDQFTAAAAAAQRQTRRQAYADVMSQLFDGQYAEIPAHYDFTVYVAAEGWLNPVWPPSNLNNPEDDVRRFEAGKGATGNAYSQSKVFWVVGDDVSNDVHHLNAEQQAEFSRFRTVASAPIYDLWGEAPLGAVTVLSEAEEPEFWEPGAPGQRALLQLAETLQVVLGRLVDPDDLR